jgi:pilus assembly protein Flp/PilA
MKEFLLPVLVKMQDLIAREDGQDLVEYALVVALIAFAAVAGMQTLASDINSVFASLGSQLSSVV